MNASGQSDSGFAHNAPRTEAINEIARPQNNTRALPYRAMSSG